MSVAIQLLGSRLVRLLNRFGLQLERRGRNRDAWLKSLGINTVLDIGANQGHFSEQMRQLLPGATIHAFEPIPECFVRLRAMSDRDPLLRVHNIALGDTPGDLTFNKNRFNASSSFLELSRLHRTTFAHADTTEPTTVRVERLDDVLAGVDLRGELLVKMDVQGFEDRVIRGGQNVLSRARAVITEVCFQPLYEGQPLFGDIHTLLVDLGFVNRGFLEQHRSPIDDAVLFGDAVYIRPAAIPEGSR